MNCQSFYVLIRDHISECRLFIYLSVYTVVSGVLLRKVVCVPKMNPKLL